MTSSVSAIPSERIPFYRDTRILAIIAQIIFVIVFVAAVTFIYRNMSTRLAASGGGGSALPFNFGFLGQTAGFAIAEGPAFSPEESYGRAFVVGVLNTLRIAVVGIVLATLLGILTGIARLSNNFLLRTIAGAYVELIRSTPLLVQLFFLYFAVILKLPDLANKISVPGLGIISNRGVVLNWFFVTESGRPWLYWLLAGVVVGGVVVYLRRRSLAAQDRVGMSTPYGMLALLLVAVIGYGVTAMTASLPANITYELRRGDRGVLFVDVNGNGGYDRNIDTPMRYIPVSLKAADGTALGTVSTDGTGSFRFFEPAQEGVELSWDTPGPLLLSEPELQGFNIQGGMPLSPEFAGLLLGLVLYTAAFIAEIVRAGINAVSKGQTEAARALGLKPAETLRLIVLPQAMRVIIPPMTSQYLNLTKNSSLAIAIGYPDLFNVSLTVLNQSGAEVQMFILIMGTYLTISLMTSAIMNWYNSRVALVER